jgi:hypothetical protein
MQNRAVACLCAAGLPLERDVAPGNSNRCALVVEAVVGKRPQNTCLRVLARVARLKIRLNQPLEKANTLSLDLR